MGLYRVDEGIVTVHLCIEGCYFFLLELSDNKLRLKLNTFTSLRASPALVASECSLNMLCSAHIAAYTYIICVFQILVGSGQAMMLKVVKEQGI